MEISYNRCIQMLVYFMKSESVVTIKINYFLNYIINLLYIIIDHYEPALHHLSEQIQVVSPTVILLED